MMYISKRKGDSKMKKSRTMSFFATGMMLFLLTGGAWAYDFNDSTEVEKWTGSTNTHGLYDVIGSLSDFNTRGANLSSDGKTLTIYTNWKPAKDDIRGNVVGVDYRLYTADVFIDKDLDGDFDYAVQLDTLTGTGNAYDLTTYQTSQDFWKTVVKNSVGPTYWSYGGQFIDTYASPHSSSLSPVPVIATGTLRGSTASVVWGTTGDSSAPYSVAVNLSDLGLVNDWYFVWGTATCGNDTFSGQVRVPEPTSMLLLGLGLLGVAGARRKFRR
jgi:hypothetical protein